MDSSTLERLAAGGFGALSEQEATDLGPWCQEWCNATGDGRFAIIGAILDSIYIWRTEYEESGGVPQGLLRSIEVCLTEHLGLALAAEARDDGAYWADNMRREVLPLLLPPERWPE